MKFADVTPNLVVADVARSLAFYRDVLGFSLVASVPEASPYVFAWVQRDNVNVFLNSAESVKEHATIASRAIGGTNTLFIVLEAATSATAWMRCSRPSVDARRCSCRSRTSFTACGNSASRIPTASHLLRAATSTQRIITPCELVCSSLC